MAEEIEKSDKEEQEKKEEFNDEEKINLLPFLTLVLFFIVIFQFWQIFSLKKKLKMANQIYPSYELVQTRDYLKKLYDYYECKDYNSATSTSYQIYNLLLCLKEKAENKEKK